MINTKKVQNHLKEKYQLAVGEVALDKICGKLRKYANNKITIEGRSYASGRRKKVKIKVIDLITS